MAGEVDVALKVAAQIENPEDNLYARTKIAWAVASGGDREYAEILCSQFMTEINDEPGIKDEVAVLNVAFVYSELGERERAGELIGNVEARADALGDKSLQDELYLSLAEAYIQNKEYDTAMRVRGKIANCYAELPMRCYFLMEVATGWIDEGKIAEALTLCSSIAGGGLVAIVLVRAAVAVKKRGKELDQREQDAVFRLLSRKRGPADPCDWSYPGTGK